MDSFRVSLSLVLVFAPELLPDTLTADLTPAVGWTAFGVGVSLSAAATWQIVQIVRERLRGR